MSEDDLKNIEAETQSEINQILSEVEELRKELNQESSNLTEPEGMLEEVQASQESAPPTGQTGHPAKTGLPPVNESVVSEAPAEEDDSLDAAELMKEFQASFGENSDENDADEGLESHWSELKEDPSVKTLLDETLEDQAERIAEKAMESEEDSAPARTAPKSVKKVIMKDETGNSRNVPTLMSERSDDESPTLTMTLNGSMTLRLKYEFAGQEVTVGFVDGFLKVELADGTEFKIPVERQKSLRRIA